MPGNVRMLDKETGYTTTARVPTEPFGDVFRKFLRTHRQTGYMNSAGNCITVEARPVKNLIGDSEKVFWSQGMLELYRRNNIQWRIVNSKRDGHRQMTILDRVVRTIRDMNFKVHYNETTNVDDAPFSISPREMNRLAEVYNHTWHRTLSEAIGERITPYDVHYNEALERKIIRNARVANYVNQMQPGYILEVGQKVLVKNDNPETFQKRRTPYIPGIWEISERTGNMYVLVPAGSSRSECGDQILIKPRSSIVRRK